MDSEWRRYGGWIGSALFRMLPGPPGGFNQNAARVRRFAFRLDLQTQSPGAHNGDRSRQNLAIWVARPEARRAW